MTSNTWVEVKDGNEAAFALFQRHYSYYHYKDGRREDPKYRNRKLFVGPGQKMVLLAVDGKALFVWRKFIDASGQIGVNCAVFRNESAVRASDLILAAETHASARWPGERLYTYVNQDKLPHGKRPGYCFEKSGWSRCGTTKGGLLILEKITVTMLWHPYAETFPLMQGAEWEAFKADILASKGNNDPVMYRVMGDVGTGLWRQYLDGRNRARACQELQLPMHELQIYLEDGEVKAFIDSRNIHRRHLTAEWRRERVLTLSSEGLSTRAIAAQLGVSQSVVVKDQKVGEYENSGASEMPTQLSGKPLPELVKGQDGKEYSREKTARAKPSRNGKELFDWKEHQKIFNAMYRQIDVVKRAARMKHDSPRLEELQRMLLELDSRFRDWADQVLQPAMAPRPKP